jgi:hypothetical protein
VVVNSQKRSRFVMAVISRPDQFSKGDSFSDYPFSGPQVTYAQASAIEEQESRPDPGGRQQAGYG